MTDVIKWNFSINEEKLPSTNIARLLNLLSFKSLEFITDEYFDKPKKNGKLFDIVDVSMVGTVHYVKHELQESVNKLKMYIKNYVESEESLEDKIYELSSSRIAIKEYFIGNNLYDPLLIDLGALVTINSRHTKQKVINNSGTQKKYTMDVRWGECNISEHAGHQIASHQHLRSVYINILDNYIAIEIDRLHLQPLKDKRENIESTYEKEMQLLEVWIGLKETGFLGYLPNSKMHSEHRKFFFESFQLTDRNFNVRKGEIKKRVYPVARLLPLMTEKLEKLHKKKKR